MRQLRTGPQDAGNISSLAPTPTAFETPCHNFKLDWPARIAWRDSRWLKAQVEIKIQAWTGALTFGWCILRFCGFGRNEYGGGRRGCAVRTAWRKFGEARPAHHRSTSVVPKQMQQLLLQKASCKRSSIRSCWRRIVLCDPSPSRIPSLLCRSPLPSSRYPPVSFVLACHWFGVGIPISLRTWIVSLDL